MTDTAAPTLPQPLADPSAEQSSDQPRAKSQAGSRGKSRGQPERARTQRKPSPVLERLFELYPRMFGARFLPLKLGVYQELMALHPDEFKKEDLKLALGQHARSTRYLEAVAQGEQRHDLSGTPVEPVAPEHVHHAILEIFRRRQARGQEAAVQWLRQRFVAAIEASGLARDAYMERMPVADETAATVLGEAFAEIDGKTARREALRRAYEASGKTVQEFAGMYGMDAAQVRRTLGLAPD